MRNDESREKVTRFELATLRVGEVRQNAKNSVFKLFSVGVAQSEKITEQP